MGSVVAELESGDQCKPADLLLDLIGGGQGRLQACAAVSVELLRCFEQLQVAEDGHQRVVDLVADRGGEGGDRAESLGLPVRSLRPLPVGDISDQKDSAGELLVLGEDRMGRDDRPEIRAVGTLESKVELLLEAPLGAFEISLGPHARGPVP